MAGTLRNTLETLEERIAPAVVIDGGLTVQDSTTGTYVDADGDTVTVHFNKNIFDQSLSQLEDAFTLAPNVGDATRFSLASLDLSKLGLSDSALTGLSISVTSEKVGLGDGLAHVGMILGTDIDLDTVTIDGALGKITAGDGIVSTAGLKSLVVDTLGLVDSSMLADMTQLQSRVHGNIDSFYVAHNINKADFTNAGPASVMDEVYIGGDLIGGDFLNSGGVYSEGFINHLVIKGDLRGGSDFFSGSVSAIRISTASVTGGLYGGMGIFSGSVRSSDGGMILLDWGTQNLGYWDISGIYYGEDIELDINDPGSAFQPLDGDLVKVSGTTGTFTDTDGDLVTVTFNKNIFDLADTHDVAKAFAFLENPGNAGGFSLARLNLLQLGVESSVLSGLSVTITADKVGAGDGLVHVGAIVGTGVDLDTVIVEGALGKISAGDGVLSTSGMKGLVVDSLGLASGGEPADYSGVYSRINGSLDSLHIEHNVNYANFSVEGANSRIGEVFVGGDIIGGSGDRSGRISSDGSMGDVVVKGYVKGGSGRVSGTIGIQQAVETIEIGGLIGGTGVWSGAIMGSGFTTVTIKGDMVGNISERSGGFWSGANVGSITVEGDMVGGSGMLSASVHVDGQISSVVVKGDLYGGSGSHSGSVYANKILTAGVIGDLHGGPISYSGSVISQAEGMTLTAWGKQIPGGVYAGVFLGETPDLPLDASGSAQLEDGDLVKIDGATAMFTDKDGDKVTVAFSKNIFDLATADAVGRAFTFTGDATKYSLAKLDLSRLGLSDSVLSGLSITITSDKVEDGDGLVHVGMILGTGIDLNTVTVEGALGKITAGDSTLSTSGMKSLIVDSLGLADGSVPAAFTKLQSRINGSLDNLHVEHNVSNADFRVTGASSTIGTLFIGGDVIGGSNDYSGVIMSSGALGDVVIKGVLKGSSGYASGSVLSENAVNSIEVGGAVGGGGNASGSISGRGFGSVTIKGGMIGGAGVLSGSFFSELSVGSIMVGGDMVGNQAYRSGSIIVNAAMGVLTVKGGLQGGAGSYSGTIYATKILTASVEGDLHGGSGSNSGSVISDTAGMVLTEWGLQNPGTGTRSGVYHGETPDLPLDDSGSGPQVIEGDLTKVNGTTGTFTDTDGDLVTVTFNKNVFDLADAEALARAFSFTANTGDAGRFSLTSLVLTRLELGSSVLNGLSVSIMSDRVGAGDGLVHVGMIIGSGIDLGVIAVDGALGKIMAGDINPSTVGLKSLVVDSLGLDDGGVPSDFSSVQSRIEGGLDNLRVERDVAYADLSITGTIAAIYVGGDLVGGSNDYSGAIRSSGSMGEVVVKGDLKGGSGGRSGGLFSEAEMGSVEVGGTMGGGGYASGGLMVRGSVGSFIVKGDMVGGIGSLSGGFWSGGDAGSVTVEGDMIGNSGERSASIYFEWNGVISSLTIGGDLKGASGVFSGSVFARNILTASVAGDLYGGTAHYGGSVVSALGGMVLTKWGTQSPGTGSSSGTYVGEAPDLAIDDPGTASHQGDGNLFKISGTTGTFTDVDGDLVTVTFNKNIFDLAYADLVGVAFGFTANPNDAGKFSLAKLDLTRLGLSSSILSGLSVTITADKVGDGDGLVHVGMILAAGLGLDTVRVEGALGKIIAREMTSLAVDSLGLADGSAPSDITLLQSRINGSLGSLHVEHNVNYADFQILDANSTIGSVFVGGDLVGGSSNFSGTIYSHWNLGDVVVKGVLKGGSGEASGSIKAELTINTVEVGGTVGGSGYASGSASGRNIGAVAVNGGLIGAAERSGSIIASEQISSVTILGGTHGGVGAYSGAVYAPKILTAKVIGDLHGGAGAYGGSIFSGTIGMKLTQHGAENPGEGEQSGIYVGDGAPAATVLEIRNATTATYIDTDGDKVTLKFNKGIFGAGMGDYLDDIFSFAPNSEDTGGYMLDAIDFTSLIDSIANLQGLNISITAQKKGGDGFVDVGSILASGIDLGAVTVDGALGRIVGGDEDYSDIGLKSLKVNSLGLGTDSAPDVFTSMASSIAGHVTSLIVQKDVNKAYFSADGEGSVIKSIRIGGDIIGGVSFCSGSINSGGSIGTITIGGDLRGGAGHQSGYLSTNDGIGSLTVHGVSGGDGYFSGSISCMEIGRLVVEADIAGGAGIDSGSVRAQFSLGTVVVGGDIVGSHGYRSGSMGSDNGGAKSISVKGNVTGGLGAASGTIWSAGGIDVIAVGKDITGNQGTNSGSISINGSVKSISVKGDLLGGAGEASGSVYSGGNVGTITAGGDLKGGQTRYTGAIVVDGAIRSISLKGDLHGGVGAYSGSVLIAQGADVARLSKTDLNGGIGTHSGSIVSGGSDMRVSGAYTENSGGGYRSGIILGKYNSPERSSGSNNSSSNSNNSGGGSSGGSVSVGSLGLTKTGAGAMTLDTLSGFYLGSGTVYQGNYGV